MTKNPIDKLGLAISDAGYKWTPKMKAAYNQSIHERQQLIEHIDLMFNALMEANSASHRAKREAQHSEIVSGDAYMKARNLKIGGSTLWDKYMEERKNT